MGIVNCKRQSYDASLKNLKEALQIKESKLGSDNLEVASTLFQIGYLFDSWSKHERGIDYYEQAVRIRRSKLGDDDLLVAKT